MLFVFNGKGLAYLVLLFTFRFGWIAKPQFASFRFLFQFFSNLLFEKISAIACAYIIVSFASFFCLFFLSLYLVKQSHTHTHKHSASVVNSDLFILNDVFCLVFIWILNYIQLNNCSHYLTPVPKKLGCCHSCSNSIGFVRKWSP